MARIATFKLEIPVSDRASHAAIKAKLQEEIRRIGLIDVEAEPGADPALLDDDRTAFFGSASVKLWVNPGVRKPKKVA